jgi:hypothetical protein
VSAAQLVAPMALYLGTKRVRAMPMTRLAYNQLRGWTVPADENPDDAGYLVEYTDGGKANVAGFEGYVSWSPADVFDRAYRPINVEVRKCEGSPDSYWIELMDFGQALQALKAGKKVARNGWNGKGMWLSLSCDGDREVPAEQFWSPHNAAFARENGGTATVLPCITMKTTNASGRVAILMGWLASQTDMLSEDWVIVP